MQQASRLRVPVEVVTGGAPSWTSPWSRAQRAHVEQDERGWQSWLIGEQGQGIFEGDVQLARLAEENPGTTRSLRAPQGADLAE